MVKILRVVSGVCVFYYAVAATASRVPGGASASRFRMNRTRHRCQARVVTVLGPIVTVVLAVGMLAWFEVRESASDRERLDLQNHTLNEFPESSSDIGANQTAPDLDARAMLEGAGRKEWPLTDGTSIGKGPVFYVGGRRWVDVVFPAGDREDPDATCGIEALGILTTRGFSRDRTHYSDIYRSNCLPGRRAIRFFRGCYATRNDLRSTPPARRRS